MIAPSRLLRLTELYAIDLRSLALFRFGLAALVLCDLATRAWALEAHYTDVGVLPRAGLLLWDSPWHFSLHLYNGTYFYQALLFALAALAALALLVGYRTRLATVVSWLLLLSLQNRNPLLVQASDSLLLLLLFWSMFLPLGARNSVDAALARDAVPAPVTKTLSVASAGILIQSMLVYFFAALHQSGPEWIPEGTAFYYALNLDVFITPAAYWVRDIPWLSPILTYAVWLLECAGPVLMFTPVKNAALRRVLLPLFMLMQLGFILFMFVGLHAWVYLCALLLFLPAGFWDWWRNNALAAEDFQLLYRDEIGPQRMAMLLKNVLLLETAPAARDSLKTAIACMDNNKRLYTGAQGLARALRRVRVYAPLSLLMRVPGVYQVGVVGLLLPWLSRIDPPSRVRLDTSRRVQVVAALSLLFVFYVNVSNLPLMQFMATPWLAPLHDGLRLGQNWDIFAPHPMKDDGWHTVKGQLIDGSVVDLLTGRNQAPKWDKPENVMALYPHPRWRFYLLRLRQGQYQTQLGYYANYVCYRWNRSAAVDKKLFSVEIYFNYENTEPPGQPPRMDVKQLWRQDCFSRPR